MVTARGTGHSIAAHQSGTVRSCLSLPASSSLWEITFISVGRKYGGGSSEEKSSGKAVCGRGERTCDNDNK